MKIPELAALLCYFVLVLGIGIYFFIKDKTKADKWNIQSILGIASSIGSLGLTAASVANILNK